jgi:iron complex outermembrane recepter protein
MIESKKYSNILLMHVALVPLLACVGTQASFAQDDADKETVGIEEILVTASKRGSVVAQDTSMSMTAFDESKLERLGALDFDDMIVHVPGTNFIDNGGPGRGHEIASIRGLSPVADNTVSVTAQYLDGAPHFGRNYRMFDIGEVSVLRGPQGTLWGSQSQGGLISFRSNRPDMEATSAKVEVDAYTTRSASMSYRTTGFVNMPIVEDKLAIRLAGHYIDESGYVDNIITGDENVNDVKESAWRASVLFTPADNVSLTAIYHGSHLETGAATFFNIGQGDMNTIDPLSDVGGMQDYDLFNIVGEINFDWATISYNGSFYSMDNTYDDLEQAVFGFIPLGRTVNTLNEKSTTHELRVTSNQSDSKLKWVVGFYSDDYDTGLLSVQTEVENTNDPSWAPGMFEGFEAVKIGGPETFKEKAVFGEVSYDFTEKLTILAGGRYFDWTVFNDQELTYFGTNYNQISGEVTSNDSFFKFQADYRPTEDSIIYLTRSEGFRFGGFNPFVGLEGIGADVLRFDPDKLINYEIGFKTSWLDNRLVINGAIYQSDWKNVQLVVRAAPPSPWAYTTNAGQLDAKGAELEFITQDLLFPGFYFAGSFAYNTNEFADDVDPNNSGSPLIQKGDKLRRTPKHTWSLDAGYDFVVNDMDAFVRANYWHKDKTTTEGYNGGDGIIPIPAQNVINASIGMSKDNWALKVYADNLTDALPLLQVFPNAGDNTLPARASSIRPRTFGIQLSYKFGG